MTSDGSRPAGGERGPERPPAAANDPAAFEDQCRLLLHSFQWIAVGLEATGRVAYVNPAFLRISGVTAEEALGKDWFETFLPERARPRARAEFTGLLATGTAMRHVGHIVTRSGELRRIAWDSAAVQASAGRTAGSLSLGGDVTERQLVETALRDSETSYRAIIELAVDAIITIDERGTIESFNHAAERIFGYQAEEVIGRNVSLLMPSPYREEHAGYLSRYLATGKASIIGRGREVLGRRQDGSQFPLDLAVSEVRLGSRRTFTGIVRDISTRRRAEILASMGTLASGMAHEIGTPLNVILGRAERVRARVGSEPQAVRDLDIIVSQVERMTRIIQQLLAISRPHAPERRPIALNDVVRSTLEVIEERLRRHQVRLVTELDEQVPMIEANPDGLSQVLLNLVLNAIDAMPPGGTLRVKTAIQPGTETPHGSVVELLVEDTGAGIAPELLERIFDPFFTTKDAGRGTGLGLAVVHGIVRDHGGDMTVDSELGHGTRFRVALPAHSATRAD